MEWIFFSLNTEGKHFIPDYFSSELEPAFPWIKSNLFQADENRPCLRGAERQGPGIKGPRGWWGMGGVVDPQLSSGSTLMRLLINFRRGGGSATIRSDSRAGGGGGGGCKGRPHAETKTRGEASDPRCQGSSAEKLNQHSRCLC